MDERPILEIPFFRKGVWQHPVYGQLVGDDSLFRQFIENFKLGVLGSQPYVRFGHDIVPTDYTKTGDAPAVAWIEDIIERDDVIYALATPTSSEITEAVRQKKYRYSSAEFQFHFTDKETGKEVGAVLQAIALTNEPFLTKLPEVVALSNENPDLIFLDYKEVDDMENEVEPTTSNEETKSLLQKIMHLVSSLVKKEADESKETGAPSEDGMESDETTDSVKLSDYQALQRKVWELEARQHSTEAARQQTEVDLWAQQMVQQGIPPVLVEKAKPILLSNPQSGVIKLSDGAESSFHDYVKDLIASLPQANRIQLSQLGAQFIPDAGSPEEIKAQVDQDIRDLGGSIGEDGKYQI